MTGRRGSAAKRICSYAGQAIKRIASMSPGCAPLELRSLQNAEGRGDVVRIFIYGGGGDAYGFQVLSGSCRVGSVRDNGESDYKSE